MTFAEAARIMIGSTQEPVIQSLSVSENGTYTVPEGVDGYNPVNVSVPDRYQDGYNDGYDDGKADGEKDGYDSGYADGVNSVVIKPLTVTENKTYNASDYECSGFNPVNGNIPDKYQDGYDDGYDDGFEFAYGFYNKIIDSTKTYTMYLYKEAATPNYGWPDSLKWIMCQVRRISDNSLVARFNFWPGDNMTYCYNAVFTKVWYQKEGTHNGWHVEIESTDAAGENKQRLEQYLSYRSMLGYMDIYPNNTNVVCDVPPTDK